jgi:hypothetical protein
VKASRSGPASSNSAVASAKRGSSWSTIRRCCSCTVAASGWAKIVRTIVATNDWALLGTLAHQVAHKMRSAALSAASLD